MNRFARQMQHLHVQFFIDERRGHTPSAENLHRLERELDNILPEDYREFLEMYGCAALYAVHVRPCRVCPWGESLSIEFLYGFSNHAGASIEEALRRHRGGMPPNMLPIGNDAGGNQFCISVAGLDRGSVYFWDHEYRYVGSERADNMYDELAADGIDVQRVDVHAAILLWEQRNASMLDHAPGYANLYLIANTFTGFIDALELEEDHEYDEGAT